MTELNKIDKSILLSSIADKDLAKMMERMRMDTVFAYRCLAFYSFYLAAECTDRVNVFMDGMLKVSEITIRE